MDQAEPCEPAEHRLFASQMAAAQRGDMAALGWLLEAFRPYLLTVANQDLPAELWGKCGGSDLVQDTLLEAHKGFDGFNGSRPEELRAWLRGILRHNLKDWARRFSGVERRSIHREQSLNDLPAALSPANGLVDPDPTPGTSAAQREEATAVDAAIERLPTDERAVIILRNRDHLAWEDIGRRLDRTADAARMLWKRAILHLQQEFEPNRADGPPRTVRPRTIAGDRK